MAAKNSTLLKTRFCPSPTGHMHLGNVRTALFNALLSRGQKGVFLLRIEDTDRERSEERFTEMVMQDLKWLGLEWNEGPYYQSKRQDVYNEYYQKLEKQGLAYPCFCTEEQLALARKIQRSTGKPPRYSGTCRNLVPEQVKAKLEQGLKPTLRFKVPEKAVIEFTDTVHGEQRFQSDDMGDFIIRRADGTAPFLFCNAIDDALMGVTHVFRGEDHLTNTPRQIMLLNALQLSVPQYGHIPLILGHDGSPLAKRHGSRSIDELRSEGYFSIAIINYLARLGHYYGHDQFLSLDELAQQFKVENLNKSPAKFNLEQLNYMQKEAVARLDHEALWSWLGGEVKKLVPEDRRQDFLETIKPNIMFPKEGQFWAQILFHDDLMFGDEEMQILKSAGADYFKVAVSALEQYGTDLSKITQHLKEVLGLKGEALYSPIRVAITTRKHGPELKRILQLLDKKEIRRRLETAL